MGDPGKRGRAGEDPSHDHLADLKRAGVVSPNGCRRLATLLHLTSKPGTPRRGEESGVALVELALVLLPLCVFVFGAVDVGRAFIFLDQLKNSAQAGAFFARSNPGYVTNTGNCADPNNIQYQVANELGVPTGNSTLPAGYGMTVIDETTAQQLTGCTELSPTSSCGAGRVSTTICSGDTLQVQVTAPFHLITPLIGSIVGSNLTLHGTSQVVVP
jgi:Flp pilus assembly protein TadG